jgi:hypothetical protein
VRSASHWPRLGGYSAGRPQTGGLRQMAGVFCGRAGAMFGDSPAAVLEWGILTYEAK